MNHTAKRTISALSTAALVVTLMLCLPFKVVLPAMIALVALVHKVAHLQDRIQLLLREGHTGVVAHHHMYGRCRREVYVAQELGVDAQGVTFETLLALELLNDRARKGNAHRAGRELILVLINGNIALTL